ncbi:lantibiotic dehydratase family protein [Aquimarina sp. 2304DJ70-9]|uniref:lantibiotic dehydratase family protein n=1 Tax=Aquimarina penaris TaxID=3231044 RepID=UPI0034622E26
MKQKNPYTFFEEFCIRTPLLSLDFYYHLTKDKQISIEAYREIWNDNVVKEAIFLASPELFLEIEKWLSNQTSDPKKIQRLQSSLLKYLSRMSSRCTPFGLFAGCSIGTFGKLTTIELPHYSENQRQTRFDMNFLVAFSQKLSKEKNIKNQLLWFPNNSLYKIGQQYRYIEYTYNKYNRRQHSIEAVTHTPYLEIIIKNAQSGKKVEELASLLVDDEISKNEAQEFIYQLIDNQILVSELEPSVSGKDFLLQIHETLKKLKDTDAIINQISYFQEFLDRIDQTVGNSVDTYHKNNEEIKKLDIDFELKYLFQTDMYTKTLQNQLDVQFAYKAKRVMNLLNKISTPPQDSNLQRFKNAFIKRYETREIPLAQALDTEIGIGYLQNQEAADYNPFLDGIDIPPRHQETQNISWNPANEILHKKLHQLSKDNAYILQLEDQDFEHLPANWNDLPDTLSSLVEIITINGKQKLVLQNMGGSSAANLLGRFSTGNTQIMKQVQHIANLEQEMNHDKLLTEIIHLPESRTGNVIRRATIRNYEIPYLGKSNLPKEQQIFIDDLMISVKRNRIVLRSKVNNTEVLPKLTNAHNYRGQNSLPIYHFLCDLQQQNLRSSIGFYWGKMMDKNTFLPRVEYKDFIFSKARWKITTKNISSLLESINNTQNSIVEIAKWRSKHQIPQYVQLIDNDNTLLINLENMSSVKMLFSVVKNRAQFILEEFLFTEESVIKSQKKNYSNQFVFSFYNEEKLNHSKKKSTALLTPDTKTKNEENILIR